MQIAGSKCKVCGRNIVLSSEGKFCALCNTAVHLACEAGDKCDVCGQAFQQYERPKADPLGEAILPRPNKSGGPMIAAGLMLLIAFLIFIVYYGIMEALAHGH